MDRINIIELLQVKPYYNICVLLMASQGHFKPLLEIHGEKQGFIELKETLDYSNFVRGVDLSTHPIGLTENLEILRPHHHVAAALIAGRSHIYYMTCRESAPDFGENWIKNYRCAESVKEFYLKIPEIFNL